MGQINPEGDDRERTYALLRPVGAKPISRIAVAVGCGGIVAAGLSALSWYGAVAPYGWSQEAMFHSLQALEIVILDAVSLIAAGVVIELIDRILWVLASDEDRLAMFRKRRSLSARNGAARADQSAS